MAHIETPESKWDAVKSLDDFLRISGEWHEAHEGEHGGMLSELWFRGVNAQFGNQSPGVYRQGFTDRASKLAEKGDSEAKRLRLEREMISQFRTGGAVFLASYTKAQIYFTAQHFGMPTRLLDWSTNPLAAVFFACDGQLEKDGFVYAMDAKQIVPPKAMRTKTERLYQSVMTMRHAFVEYAIGLSFWSPLKEDHIAHVLPVRPDAAAGRIGQQSSCFTLDMHGASPVNNPTLITIRVDASSKKSICQELHRVNINQFTTYYDLDHLSKQIKAGWGV